MSETDPPRPAARLRRRIGVGVVGLLLLASAMVLGGRLERAEVVGNYRPPLPPSALEGRCSPLPSGVRLGFEAVLRSDRPTERRAAGEDGERARLVVLHALDLDADRVRETLDADLVAAGFTADPGAGTYARADVGTVTATVTPLPTPGVPEDDAIVRAEVRLLLPAATMPERENCSRAVTKRLPPAEEGP